MIEDLERGVKYSNTARLRALLEKLAGERQVETASTVKDLYVRGAREWVKEKSLREVLEKGHPDMAAELVKLFLEWGANADGGFGRWKPIHYAASHKAALGLVPLLCSKGADLDALTEEGETALHLAVEAAMEVEEPARVIKVLIERGVKTHVLCTNTTGRSFFGDGFTALDLSLDMLLQHRDTFPVEVFMVLAQHRPFTKVRCRRGKYPLKEVLCAEGLWDAVVSLEL